MLSINPTADAALASALADRDRRMVMRLEVDWNRDGLYSHLYSDLTSVTESCSTDRSTSTLLPEEVNTLTGYSSGQLTATLSGRRAYGELTMSELFDPYNESSPLYGTGALLLPIRYSRVTQTSLGDVALPVFTGYIRSAPFSRRNQSVDITAGDHEDFQSAPVTLPLWAVLATSAEGGGGESQDFPGSRRPSNLSWFVEETLRLAGRAATPVPRADAVAYHTCAGSMLPSVGHRSDSYQMPRVTVGNPDYSVPTAWETGPFGLVPKEGTNTYATYASMVKQFIPTDGSGSPQVNIGCSTFVKAVSTAGSSSQYYYLDDYEAGNRYFEDPPYVFWEDADPNAGAIRLKVSNTGAVEVMVRETLIGMPGGSRVRLWTYNNPAVVGNWYHYNLVVKFTGSNIVPELRVDGVVKTLTPNGGNPAASGYRYRATSSLVQAGGTPNKWNAIRDESLKVPHCHVQWYVGGSTTGYLASQVAVPTMINGKPRAVVGALLGSVSWVPDVDQVGAWEVLKKIISAEYGILYIDEYGTVRVSARSVAQSITVPMLLASIDLTDDQLDELVVMPTSDSKRNTISATWTHRGEIESDIYTQQSATERPVDPFESFSAEIYLKNVTGVSTALVWYPADPTGIDFTQRIVQFNYASVVKISDRQQGTYGAGLSQGIHPHTRSFTLGWTGNGVEPIYMGSALNANQAFLGIAGRKYAELQTTTTSFSDSTDVAAYGRRSLSIGEGNEWFQTPESAQAIAQNLLIDTVHPAPMVESITVPADPRRQLFDILRITNETGSSGVIFGQILSKSTSDDNTGRMTDTLTLRVVNTPNTWLLGITGASELGLTTTLS